MKIGASLVFCFVGYCSMLCEAVAADDVSGRVLVFAAASTTGAMEEIRAEFSRLHPGVTVRVSYGASSALAQQIGRGAQADIFLSASTDWSNFLEQRQLAAKTHALLSNELVVVVPSESALEIKTPADLGQAGIRHLALADTKSVPAGIYARQALTKLGLWPQLERKVTGAADVLQALHFVETGAAEAGIVYATEAALSKKVRLVLRLDADLSDPIRYPLVLLKQGAANSAATAYHEFLMSATARDVFKRQGFLVLDSAR